MSQHNHQQTSNRNEWRELVLACTLLALLTLTLI